MSLREEYTGLAAKEAEARNPLSAPLETAAGNLQHDLRFMAQAVCLQNKSPARRFFAALRAGGPRGTRDPEANTLTFPLSAQRETLKGVSYWSSFREATDSIKGTWGYSVFGQRYMDQAQNEQTQFMLENNIRRAARERAEELQQALLAEARQCSAYSRIHALCANPDVDMRVELVAIGPEVGHKQNVNQSGAGYAINRDGDTVQVEFRLALRVFMGEGYAASSDAKRMTKPAVAAPKV